jgi:hypothetical protein
LAAFGAIIMAGKYRAFVVPWRHHSSVKRIGNTLPDRFPNPAKARWRGLGFFSLVMTLLAFLAFIGSSVMWKHLGNPKDAVRLDILKDSLRMFALKPFSGWGLGTFQVVYPFVPEFLHKVFC